MPIFPQETPEPGDPGALIASAYQYEFRGLLFGAGTDYVTQEVTGILGAPTARDADQDKKNDHGVNPGILLYGKRIIQFNLTISGVGGLDIEGKLADARRTFQAPMRRYSLRLEEFVFQRPGEPKKVLFARCTKRDFTSDYRTARGLASGSVELQAPDPRIYSLEVHHADLSLPENETTDTIVIVNSGDHEDGAEPTITLHGPWNDPVIENTTDEEREFKLNFDLGPTDHVRVNFKTRIIEVSEDDGPFVENFTILSPDSRWWVLHPGQNTLQFTRGGGAVGLEGSAEVDWRDVYA